MVETERVKKKLHLFVKLPGSGQRVGEGGEGERTEEVVDLVNWLSHKTS